MRGFHHIYDQHHQDSYNKKYGSKSGFRKYRLGQLFSPSCYEQSFKLENCPNNVLSAKDFSIGGSYLKIAHVLY